MIQNRTPHTNAIWLSVADVARRLRCSRWTALRTMRREGGAMGAEMAYAYDGRKGERWHCNSELFERWLRARGLVATA